ncbi:MAG: AI-2E family transporter [Fuerstiella sp.]
MSRKHSLPVLFLTVAVIGVLFFRVIQPFVFSLLFAGILAILFRPTYGVVCRLCRGWRRVAAGITTLGIVLAILVPLSAVLLLAANEAMEAGRGLVDRLNLDARDAARRLIDPDENPQLAHWVESVEKYFSPSELQGTREMLSSVLRDVTRLAYDRTLGLAANLIMFIMNLTVMLLGLYYFLVDGALLTRETQRLLPLDDEDVQILFNQFQKVCRGVVLGTVVAAALQAFFSGVAFAIVGVQPIWLLVVLVMLTSFVPFLGAAAVWMSVAVYLLIEHRYGAATFLTIYGTFVISGCDNLIRAFVIGDRLQMHPFVALVTVLGALQLVGLWGIFVGPVTAAFFYALLNILREHMLAADDSIKEPI